MEEKRHSLKIIGIEKQGENNFRLILEGDHDLHFLKDGKYGSSTLVITSFANSLLKKMMGDPVDKSIEIVVENDLGDFDILFGDKSLNQMAQKELIDQATQVTHFKDGF